MRIRRMAVWLVSGLLLAAGSDRSRGGEEADFARRALPDCSEVSEDRAGVSRSLAAIWPGAHLRFFLVPHWHLCLANRPDVVLPVDDYDLSVVSFRARKASRQSTPVLAGVEVPLGFITLVSEGIGGDHFTEVAISFPDDGTFMLSTGVRFGNRHIFRLNNPETWSDD